MTDLLHDRRTRSTGLPPPLFWLAATHCALFLTSLALLSVVASGSAPLPGDPPGPLLAFLTANSGLLASVGMLQLGAAVVLALFAATAADRLDHLDAGGPGGSVLLVGGVAAAAMLALSGLVTATGGVTALSLDAPTATALHQAAFVLGGAGYLGFFGLMLLGLAAPAARSGLLPRWLGAGCLAVAAVAEVATLSLAVEPLTVTIPLARFGGLAVLLAAGMTLPAGRER